MLDPTIHTLNRALHMELDEHISRAMSAGHDVEDGVCDLIFKHHVALPSGNTKSIVIRATVITTKEGIGVVDDRTVETKAYMPAGRR